MLSFLPFLASATLAQNDTILPLSTAIPSAVGAQWHNSTPWGHLFLLNNCSSPVFVWTLTGEEGVSEATSLAPSGGPALELPDPVGARGFTVVFALEDNFEQAAAKKEAEYVHFTTPGLSLSANYSFQLDRIQGIPPYQNDTFTYVEPFGDNCACPCAWMKANINGSESASCFQHCDVLVDLCKVWPGLWDIG